MFFSNLIVCFLIHSNVCSITMYKIISINISHILGFGTRHRFYRGLVSQMCHGKVYENKKNCIDPTKYGSSNHRYCHDASWGAVSARARSREDRTSGPWNGAPMEDTPERTRTVVVVSVASMLLWSSSIDNWL
jgi:hypothetical protein